MLKWMIREYIKSSEEEGEIKQYLWNLDGRKNGPPYNYNIKILD